MNNLMRALKQFSSAAPCGSKEELNAVIELEKSNSDKINKIMEYLWMIHQEVKVPEKSKEEHKCVIIKMTPPHEREPENK